MKKLCLLIIVLISLSCFKSVSQISITSYSINALGVNTSKDKLITGELKALFNRNWNDTAFQLSGLYNFKPSKYHRFSAGIGVECSPLEGDLLPAFLSPVQLEIFPLDNFRQLSLVVEFTPRFCLEDVITFQHLWGFRYTFGK